MASWISPCTSRKAPCHEGNKQAQFNKLQFICGIFSALNSSLTIQLQAAQRKILYKASPNKGMPGQAQRGGDSIATTHSQLGARRRRVFNIMLSWFTSRKRPSTHCTCTEGWVVLKANQDSMKYLAPTRIRSSDFPARIKLLYQLSYPYHQDQ